MPDFLARPRPGEPPWEQDLNKGGWIPDLFMERVREGGRWMLFDAQEVPDLHPLFGRRVPEALPRIRSPGGPRGDQGIPANPRRWNCGAKSWPRWPKRGSRGWASRTPPISARSRITPERCEAPSLAPARCCRTPAACSLGAINLAAHVDENGLDAARLGRTVAAAMRMLDNALDISAFPSPALQAAAREQRAAGLGITGFQEALYQLRLPYGSAAAAEFADRSMELISHGAILESTALARERGPCPAHAGSKWGCGLLPADTLALLEAERGCPVTVGPSGSLDWALVRDSVKRHGMRNGAVTAIGPALEGSWIAGVTPSIEPAARPWFGEGAGGARGPWNLHLVEDLRRLNLWDDAMREELRQNEHSIQQIERIPQPLRDIYRTAFEIEPRWLIECAARRQYWIDLGQSLTLYAPDSRLETLSEIYLLAWERGLITTNRLRVPELPPQQPSLGKSALVETSASHPRVAGVPAAEC